MSGGIVVNGLLEDLDGEHFVYKPAFDDSRPREPLPGCPTMFSPAAYSGELVEFHFRFDNRSALRTLRELQVLFLPRWLEDLDWDFPTWNIYWRPFDWATDDTHLVAPPEPSRYEGPERRQMDLYLRPPAPVVQR